MDRGRALGRLFDLATDGEDPSSCGFGSQNASCEKGHPGAERWEVIWVLSYLDSFLQAAAQVLTEHGVEHRAVELSWQKHFSPAPILRKIFEEKPAGVILWIPGWTESLRPLLDQTNIPLVVCSDAAPPDLLFSTVGTDLLRGTEIALRHLFDLGHRHIAFVSDFKSYPVCLELAASFQKGCRQFGIPSTAIWYAEDYGGVHEMLLEQRKQCPEVTAIFGCITVPASAMKTFNVPQELSIVCVYDPGPETRSVLTTLALHDADQCIALWACTEIFSQIQAVGSGLPRPRARHALFVPDVVVRGSTRSLERGGKEEAGALAIDPPGSMGSGREAGAVPRGPSSKTYAYLKKCSNRNWRQLDLSKLANRSMTREHGWLGRDPLLHFSPGLRFIHGVAFQVIEESRNGGRAAVAFRSPQTRGAAGEELPTHVKLPVGGPLKALYFLHGCGSAQPVAFAEYRIHFKKGGDARIPLVPLGPSTELARRRLGMLKPNLQDWWPGIEQQDFPHAKSFTVFNPAEPGEYERYLYTLEWVNPQPVEEISHIEVIVDPGAGPTLALIAVTVLA